MLDTAAGCITGTEEYHEKLKRFRKDAIRIDNLVDEVIELYEISKIINIKPVDLLTNMLYRYLGDSHNYPSLPSAHTLWMDWIQYAGFRVSPKLPYLFQANGPSEGKINKEWNI